MLPHSAACLCVQFNLQIWYSYRTLQDIASSYRYRPCHSALLAALQEPVVLRKGRDVAAEAVVSAEVAQEAAAEIQAEEVLPKIARRGTRTL